MNFFYYSTDYLQQKNITFKVANASVLGGDMRINENSPRKWPKTHFQKLFLRINENSPRKWPKTHSQKLFISLFRIMSSVKKERDIAID